MQTKLWAMPTRLLSDILRNYTSMVLMPILLSAWSYPKTAHLPFCHPYCTKCKVVSKSSASKMHCPECPVWCCPKHKHYYLQTSHLGTLIHVSGLWKNTDRKKLWFTFWTLNNINDKPKKKKQFCEVFIMVIVEY